MTKKILIEGMSCSHCVNHVKEALSQLNGVTNVDVNLDAKTAVLETLYMNRSSESTEEICDVCDTICVHCATECDKFQDQHYQTCADQCKECAIECRSMGIMNNLSNKNWGL